MVGMQITVNAYLCKQEFVRWRKSHKKARINKKWHKRYGAVYKCKGIAFQMGSRELIVCPCFREMMKQEVRLANHDKVLTAPIYRSVSMSSF